LIDKAILEKKLLYNSSI